MSNPKQLKKYTILAILTASLLSSNIVLAATEGPRYFIKTNNPFWQKSFGVRHLFDNGFTADLSGIQLTLARLFGVEVESVSQLHILPDMPSHLGTSDGGEEAVPPEDKGGNKPPSPGKSGNDERAVPDDQTPWGVEVIYNDSNIFSTSGGAGVNVAVLDTGVTGDHPDLKNRISQCKDFTNKRFPVKDNACEDKHGHGTHVSGIILADGGSDGLGIFGVAPEAGLYAYKVCGNDGSCWADDIAVALRLAADEKANIINMSLGSDSDSSLIRDAINYAVSNDVLIVAAGGNDGPYEESIDYPAANVNVLGVGAFDIELAVPDWSSRGINSTTEPYAVEEKDMGFGAPGVNVESTWKDGGYAVLSGTSMASPYAAGLAAKLWQSGADEGTKAESTRDLLQQIAEDIWTLGDDDATGFGLPHL